MTDEFDKVEDLTEFMLQNGVKRLKLKDIELELSDVAIHYQFSRLIEANDSITNKPVSTEEKNTTKTLTDTDELSPEEYNELLNWSAN